MAHIVMAHTVLAHIVMAYIVTAYIVMGGDRPLQFAAVVVHVHGTRSRSDHSDVPIITYNMYIIYDDNK